MELSLNKIVSILSDRVGQPFNLNLQEELKDIVTYKSADYTRQFLDRNPLERRQFLVPFTIEMEETTKLDCDVELECPWFISTCELPQPIRSKSIIWDFVGAADYSVSYGYLEPEFISFHRSSRYTKNKPKWFWQGNKLIVTNIENLKHLGVRGILGDPRALNPCACTVGSQTCFDDDSPFPMADDILNSIIRDILNVELRNIFPEPAIVETGKSETNPGQEKN